MNVNVNTDVSSLTRSRINEVLLRHADTKSLILPGGQIRILTVNPLLQNGPQCGLVALSMAIQLLGFSNKDVSEIFEMAKVLGITVKGEIFSSQWLSDLASSLWPLYSNVVPFPEATVLVRYMDSGYAVLIPYDCDKNHEPAMRKGHGAHWSLITGFLYVEDSSTVIREASTNLHVENEDAFYVFAHHGKSKHMGLWSYSTLRRSSMQMFEVGCQRSTCDFIVPVDGLDQMRGKCVLLAKEKLVL